MNNMNTDEMLKKVKDMYKRTFFKGAITAYEIVLVMFLAMIMILPGEKPKRIWELRYAFIAAAVLVLVIGYASTGLYRKMLRWIKQGEQVSVYKATYIKTKSYKVDYPDGGTGSSDYYFFSLPRSKRLVIKDTLNHIKIKQGDEDSLYVFRDKYSVKKSLQTNPMSLNGLIYNYVWMEK